MSNIAAMRIETDTSKRRLTIPPSFINKRIYLRTTACAPRCEYNEAMRWAELET